MRHRIYLLSLAYVLTYLDYIRGLQINVIGNFPKDDSFSQETRRNLKSDTKPHLSIFRRINQDSSEEFIIKKHKKPHRTIDDGRERNKISEAIEQFTASTKEDSIGFLEFLKEFLKKQGSEFTFDEILKRFQTDFFSHVDSEAKKVLQTEHNTTNYTNLKERLFRTVITSNSKLLKDMVRVYIDAAEVPKLFRIIDKDTNNKYTYICQQFNMCREIYLFSDYMKEILIELTTLNHYQLQKVFTNFALEFQKLNLKPIAKENTEELLKYWVVVYSHRNVQSDIWNLIDVFHSEFKKYPEIGDMVKKLDKSIILNHREFGSSKWSQFQTLLDQWRNGKPVDIRFTIKELIENIYLKTIKQWDQVTLNGIKTYIESRIFLPKNS